MDFRAYQNRTELFKTEVFTVLAGRILVVPEQNTPVLVNPGTYPTYPVQTSCAVARGLFFFPTPGTAREKVGRVVFKKWSTRKCSVYRYILADITNIAATCRLFRSTTFRRHSVLPAIEVRQDSRTESMMTLAGSKEWGRGFSTHLLPGVKKKIMTLAGRAMPAWDTRQLGRLVTSWLYPRGVA